MKIIRFEEFILEELNDTPEAYIETMLKMLKSKIDKMFDYNDDGVKDEGEMTIKKAKLSSNDKSKPTFKEFGLRLESSEISTYSKLYDSLTIKFSDDRNTYALILMIDIKEALPKNGNNNDVDFKLDDIEKCYIKFKKYDLDTFEVIGQLSKNVDISKIDEEFLIELKIELDDMFGEEEEEFEIETE